jgi:hypothetical protein
VFKVKHKNQLRPIFINKFVGYTKIVYHVRRNMRVFLQIATLVQLLIVALISPLFKGILYSDPILAASLAKRPAERMIAFMAQKSPKTSSVAPREPIRSNIFTHYVGELDVKPRQQSRLTLGLYSDTRPAKGFSISYHPEPSHPEALSVEITSLGRTPNYELTLKITNFSDQKTVAEVWSM